MLCLKHHNKATAPPNLAASLRATEIVEYKKRWEEDCRKRSERIARSRTAFFMVDYKNTQRIRQRYSQLSANERLRAYEQLRLQFPEETELRREQWFNVSLEPTTSWNPTVETFVEELKTGNVHPRIFENARGHPRDPLYPVDFDGMPPSFFLYDIWCQVMVRAILLCGKPMILMI